MSEALVKFTSTATTELPGTNTSDDWAMRTPAEEKWRQMGVAAIKQILTKLVQHLSGRNFLLLLHQALPIDWTMACLEMNFVPHT